MTNRRTIITAAVALVAAPVGITAAPAQPSLSQITAYAFSFPLSEAAKFGWRAMPIIRR